MDAERYVDILTDERDTELARIHISGLTGCGFG
jgi:hypothetical protein